MPDEIGFLQGLLEGIGTGDPFSYVVVVLIVGVVTYIMWRLVREEDPPQTRSDWVRLIAIVAAGAGAITGILGIVTAFAFDSGVGPHLALAGSALFFAGFLVALISLTLKLGALMRGVDGSGD